MREDMISMNSIYEVGRGWSTGDDFGELYMLKNKSKSNNISLA